MLYMHDIHILFATLMYAVHSIVIQFCSWLNTPERTLCHTSASSSTSSSSFFSPRPPSSSSSSSSSSSLVVTLLLLCLLLFLLRLLLRQPPFCSSHSSALSYSSLSPMTRILDIFTLSALSLCACLPTANRSAIMWPLTSRLITL